MIVKIKNARLGFAELFTAKAVNDGPPTHSCVFIFEKGGANHKAIRSAMKDVAVAKWGAKGESILKNLMKKERVCLLDGNEMTDKEGNVYDGFKDNMAVRASNAKRPMVLDRDRTPLTQADGRPYSGSYVNGSIELWAQDNQYGQRINASLRGVQFYKEGDAFGGGIPVSEDEFDDLGEGADDDFDDEEDFDDIDDVA